VGVERRAEFRLQEADVPACPFDGVEGVAARDPSACRADGPGLLEDVLVPRDALLVCEDDVLVHLLVRDGAVEAVEGADAGDKKDHLRPVRALAATDGKAAAGESSEGPLLETHASTNRRRGINIPHHEGEGSRPGTPRGKRTSKWRYEPPQRALRSGPAAARIPAPPSGGRRPSGAGDRTGRTPSPRDRCSPPSSPT